MKAVFDERQWKHDPKHFMANGVVLPNPEQPKRIEVLRGAAEAAGCSFSAPKDNGLGPIAAIHSAEYLVFLETIYARWKRIEGAADEVIPNIHPDRRTASYPRSAVGQAGFHQADTACPIVGRDLGSGLLVRPDRDQRRRHGGGRGTRRLRALPAAGASRIRRSCRRILLLQQLRHCRGAAA